MRTWHEVIGSEKQQPYFRHILESVRQERERYTVYPLPQDVFNAFRFTEFDAVRVVILGQDPYHGPGQAHGLSFSVSKGIPIPPSLQNIYKELSNDIPNFQIPSHGYLKSWADQGVLLLNTVLTVRAGQANSHANLGWEIFTERVLEALNQQRANIVFMLWGSHAQRKGSLLNRQHHLVLSAPHPSPLSAYRGFFGCKHFSLANAYLTQHGYAPITWQIE